MSYGRRLQIASFRLGCALRSEDADEFLSIYDEAVKNLTDSEIHLVKERALLVAELDEDEFEAALERYYKAKQLEEQNNSDAEQHAVEVVDDSARFYPGSGSECLNFHEATQLSTAMQRNIPSSTINADYGSVSDHLTLMSKYTSTYSPYNQSGTDNCDKYVYDDSGRYHDSSDGEDTDRYDIYNEKNREKYRLQDKYECDRKRNTECFDGEFECGSASTGELNSNDSNTDSDSSDYRHNLVNKTSTYTSSLVEPSLVEPFGKTSRNHQSSKKEAALESTVTLDSDDTSESYQKPFASTRSSRFDANTSKVGFDVASKYKRTLNDVAGQEDALGTTFELHNFAESRPRSYGPSQNNNDFMRYSPITSNRWETQVDNAKIDRVHWTSDYYRGSGSRSHNGNQESDSYSGSGDRAYRHDSTFTGEPTTTSSNRRLHVDVQKSSTASGLASVTSASAARNDDSARRLAESAASPSRPIEASYVNHSSSTATATSASTASSSNSRLEKIRQRRKQKDASKSGFVVNEVDTAERVKSLRELGFDEAAIAELVATEVRNGPSAKSDDAEARKRAKKQAAAEARRRKDAEAQKRRQLARAAAQSQRKVSNDEEDEEDDEEDEEERASSASRSETSKNRRRSLSTSKSKSSSVDLDAAERNSPTPPVVKPTLVQNRIAMTHAGEGNGHFTTVNDRPVLMASASMSASASAKGRLANVPSSVSVCSSIRDLARTAPPISRQPMTPSFSATQPRASVSASAANPPVTSNNVKKAAETKHNQKTTTTAENAASPATATPSASASSWAGVVRSKPLATTVTQPGEAVPAPAPATLDAATKDEEAVQAGKPKEETQPVPVQPAVEASANRVDSPVDDPKPAQVASQCDGVADRVEVDTGSASPALDAAPTGVEADGNSIGESDDGLRDTEVVANVNHPGADSDSGCVIIPPVNMVPTLANFSPMSIPISFGPGMQTLPFALANTTPIQYPMTPFAAFPGANSIMWAPGPAVRAAVHVKSSVTSPDGQSINCTLFVNAADQLCAFAFGEMPLDQPLNPAIPAQLIYPASLPPYAYMQPHPQPQPYTVPSLDNVSVTYPLPHMTYAQPALPEMFNVGVIPALPQPQPQPQIESLDPEKQAANCDSQAVAAAVDEADVSASATEAETQEETEDEDRTIGQATGNDQESVCTLEADRDYDQKQQKSGGFTFGFGFIESDAINGCASPSAAAKWQLSVAEKSAIVAYFDRTFAKLRSRDSQHCIIWQPGCCLHKRATEVEVELEADVDAEVEARVDVESPALGSGDVAVIEMEDAAQTVVNGNEKVNGDGDGDGDARASRKVPPPERIKQQQQQRRYGNNGYANSNANRQYAPRQFYARGSSNTNHYAAGAGEGQPSRGLRR